MGFPGGSAVEEPVCNSGDLQETCLILSQEDTPKEEMATYPVISLLEIPIDRGSRLQLHGLQKSWRNRATGTT